MPRKKSLVHTHFRVAENQPQEKKLEVVSCIHCGKPFAGNNAARLLEHLQKGCWPANAQNDPGLEMNADGTPMAPSSYTPAPPRPAGTPQSSTKQTNMKQSSRVVNFAPKLPSTSPTHFIVQTTVKETKDPIVARLIAAPVTYTFRHLQRALSIAFGYKSTSGMFEVASPAPMSGRGRLPRTRRLYIFSDQEQRMKWHKYEPDSDSVVEEQMVDDVLLQTVLADLQHCKITFTVSTWAHDIEVLGTVSLAGGLTGKSARHALCISGEGHPVPESTDAMMWETFKEAYQASNPNAQQRRYRAFYEEELVNGDPRGLAHGGPWRWEREHVNRELSMLPPAPLPVNLPAGPTAAGQDPANGKNGAPQHISDADPSDEDNDNENAIDDGAGHEQPHQQTQAQSAYHTPGANPPHPPNPYQHARPSHPGEAGFHGNDEGYMSASALQSLRYA